LTLTTALFLIQPLARLWGRIAHGLTPWRRRTKVPRSLPQPRNLTLWSETWRSAEDWLTALEMHAQHYTAVLRGGDFDNWDLRLRGGVLGSVRLTMAVEEHGAGRQLLRFRVRPYVRGIPTMICVLLAAFAATA